MRWDPDMTEGQVALWLRLDRANQGRNWIYFTNWLSTLLMGPKTKAQALPSPPHRSQDAWDS